VEFKLETGRKNQIRVHTADMGHKVFESESVMNIIQSIGVRFGVEGEDDKEANIDKLRP
jgi:hypothetical protein